ncbi:protein fantom [Takifugu rubripes]|uniref:Protein fantom-like n=1 Tax=Takifugu rubripes TaxID=31033 RepID=H2SW23_TAKRU|nr:protein fantom-like [Takifugu rubripes]
MSLLVDETAGDLPVRDVGLMRGGLMPAVPDHLHDVKAWKRHLMKTKDPQSLFRLPKEHLEDLCVKLRDENSILRQHARTQEQKLRRMSTRFMRLRQQGSNGLKERDMEDTIQELEARVDLLETQKGALQNKLGLAKQHIMDLGGRTPYKSNKGKSAELEGGIRRATHTAPPRYGPMLEDPRTELEKTHRRSSVVEQLRIAELVQAAQALRDTLRDKEKEMEGTAREVRKQQTDKLRISIKENIDSIRLQKQLSEKNVSLAVLQEKFNNLHETYENQLEETQRSLKETQAALLQRVDEVTEQLKQERQRALELEGHLTTSNLSLQNLDKLQERISDLEGERDLIKENYNTLLESTLSVQSKHDVQMEKSKEEDQKRDRMELYRLEERLQTEREERNTLEQEIQKLRRERELLEEQKDTEVSAMARNKQEMEMELVRYKQQVSSLQDRLDAVTKEFDMSVEDLSETLLQIKAFRMQQESQAGLSFLCTEGNTEDSLWDLATIRASHAETVLELQKTRQLLLLEHHISQDLQEELKIVTQKMEKEREESQRKVAAKDKLLSKRALHINTLQAQLKEMAYNPRKSRPTVPIQYTWPAEEQDVMPSEDETPFTQLRAGESLLEIHLKAATFTPAGLRVMRSIHPGGNEGDDILTFCTYSFLDFEMHSTPVVSGGQPSYSFTSRYALTTRDLCRLEGQGFRMRLELHQGLGGVRFVTHGSGQISLMGTMERPGERISGRVSISGSEGESVGVVDYWVRLFSPAVPIDAVVKTAGGTAVQRRAEPGCLGWQDTGHKELYDYGGGIPNELVIMLEHCVGLSTRWPGLFPDAYLTYRFYDLPPHVSQTARCSADPVFNDSASYSLAVTADVLRYLRSSSLWVYVFDESDEQIPPPYLAKTPIPLGALATGREVKGDYVLRDPAGSPRGVVRVTMRWKYPFQPSVDAVLGKEDGVMDSSEREERREREASHKPVAKPRVKTQTLKRESREGRKGSKPAPPPVKQKSLPSIQPEQPATKKRSAAPSRPLTRKPSEVTSSRQSPVTLSRRSSASGVTTQDLPSGDQVSQDEEEGKEERSESANSDAPETSDSSDIVIPSKQMRQGDKLRVEILSLTFEPSSRVALDKSVQRVYVEYRLLGVPMETTETPMSLRKPTKGEEIHYNFTRVIYVDGSQSTSLRRYLYTMLEGSDPNQGRLKFTVVSEPMDEDEECVDVGHAFLDLKDLLLTGNDVIEQQIDIVSLDEDKEVIGNLKVSLEAAKALTGIYQEFHQKSENQEEEDTSDEREEEEEKQKMKEVMQLIDYDDDSDL